MKEVKFDVVAVGSQFLYNGEEWTKTEKVKINCCKFNNAVSVSDSNKKVGVKPQEIVEVSE
jgi:hypothetical protein